MATVTDISGSFSKIMAQYVYRYVDTGGGETKYVGITSNMKKRVEQHRKDKIGQSGLHFTIYYFQVNKRLDAELLETYLINFYKTGKYFNVAKADKGDVSFLDNNCFPWVKYPCQNVPLFNYKVVEKEAIKETEVERVVYRNRKSIDQILKERDEIVDMLLQEKKGAIAETETIKKIIKMMIKDKDYAQDVLRLKSALKLWNVRLTNIDKYLSCITDIIHDRHVEGLKAYIKIGENKEEINNYYENVYGIRPIE